MSVLQIDDLHTYFDTESGTVRAVEGIDLTIEAGEIVGLVGESGSGKSVTASSIMDLVQHPGRIADGTVRYDGQDVLSLSEDELAELRGGEISMIFQDPMDAFNPTQTVGRQLHDVLRSHREGSVHPLVRALGLDHDADCKAAVVEMLDAVGIPNPEARYSDYPHEFSGGMIQRAMVGMALLCDPKLVLADEPTTGLDVSIERQILGLFKDLVEELDTAVLWITHDLSVVAKLCDRVVVMYAGKVMEVGSTEAVLSDPASPYTQALLDSIPRYDRPDEEMYVMEGDVPDPLNRPDGCRFADRCPEVHDRCHDHHPPRFDTGDREVACYLAEGDAE
ncbi:MULTISPECIES: ABC transporter ATP-binding protein [Halolamina]|uniref:Nickel import system ATP-binding protein NikD n=1 Tax=Halolamina pelagica TaxID=699431 RepID=A0A1I5W985_9EURY|nr:MULTISPECIES: ABC transporter ATP-binding protein [Halolamina]NHX37503.1 ABC transporter ATP-binding protein [Halolamina sp. R1-12]SFQ16300.1 peptide/nickel transport system ATP-binding protein/oligopeptide transport system ATP-binding protein [Halolamina pelagica]